MNDVEDRLSELLGRVGDGVEVRPDLERVVQGADAAIVGTARRAGAWRAATALAAAVLVLAAVGIVRQDDGERVASGPASARFPAFGELPAGLTAGAVRGAFADTPHPTDGERAVIGRRGRGGKLTDLALATVSSTPPDIVVYVPPSEGCDDCVPQGESIRVGPQGLEATRSTPGSYTTLVFAGSPTLVVSGHDPYSLFGRDAPFVVRPGPTLHFGTLPRGIEVLVPPGPIVPDARPPVLMTDTRRDRLSVLVYADDPLAVLADAGLDAVPAVVAGRPGWRSPRQEGSTLVWSLGPGRTLYLSTTLDLPDALAAAEEVHLVDEATWRRRYTVYDGNDTTPVTSPTG